MSRRCFMLRRLFASAIAVWVMASSPATAQESALDYPQWRGPDRDGSAAAFVEPVDWPQQLNR
ncbi:MAG: hypothetical protein V3T48_10915, partial [Vicinamibacterales bacterium]